MSDGAVKYCLCRKCVEARGEVVAAGWVCLRCGQRRCPCVADHRKRCLLDEREAEELREQRAVRSSNDAPG
jgi:hypothetical protein